MSPSADDEITGDAFADLKSIRVPVRERAPLPAIARRIGFALALVLFIAVVVLAGRSGYTDGATGDSIGLIDALYYASVTVTTTGYGDITAVGTGARLATILLITPARILFLILVVGTTVEVLTDQSRAFLATRRWRKRVKDHIIICGFGSTGQAAARELCDRNVPKSQIVAVDAVDAAIAAADRLGFVSVHGNATQRFVLQQASIDTARAMLIVPSRDDTAVLIALTAREMNPKLHIVAAGRESENLHLLRQGGADEVIDATASLGHLLGLATEAPGAVSVVEDVLDAASGLELAEVAPVDVDGSFLPPTDTMVVSVLRNGERFRPTDPKVGKLRRSDRLVVVRDVEG